MSNNIESIATNSDSEFNTRVKQLGKLRNKALGNLKSDVVNDFNHEFMLDISEILKSILALKDDQKERADLLLKRVKAYIEAVPPMDEKSDTQQIIWADQDRSLPEHVNKQSLAVPFLTQYFDALDLVYDAMLDSAKKDLPLHAQLALRTKAGFAPLAAYFVDRHNIDPFDPATGLQAMGVTGEDGNNVVSVIENYKFSKTDNNPVTSNEGNDESGAYIV